MTKSPNCELFKKLNTKPCFYAIHFTAASRWFFTGENTSSEQPGPNRRPILRIRRFEHLRLPRMLPAAPLEWALDCDQAADPNRFRGVETMSEAA